MKEVIGTARNIIKMQAQDKTWGGAIEMIFIVSEPAFQIDSAGQMVKINKTETLRCVTSVKGARALSEDILKWADEAEKANTEAK